MPWFDKFLWACKNLAAVLNPPNQNAQFVTLFGWLGSQIQKKMLKCNVSTENAHLMLWPDQSHKNLSNQGMDYIKNLANWLRSYNGLIAWNFD